MSFVLVLLSIQEMVVSAGNRYLNLKLFFNVFVICTRTEIAVSFPALISNEVSPHGGGSVAAQLCYSSLILETLANVSFRWKLITFS